MKVDYKNPRILHVIRQFHPAIGGIENVVFNISLESIKTGYEVSVLTLNRIFKHKELLSEFEKIDGLQIIRIPFFGSSRYAIAFSVLKFVKNFDIIHIHSSDFFLDFLALTKFIHKKKLVLHSHGLYFHTNFASILKNIYFHTITKLSLNFIDAILCVSNKDLNLLKKITQSSKLFLVPNGLNENNIPIFQPSNRDPNMIISVGRLSENKRYDLLIKSFAEIIKNQPGMKLFIIGKDDGELANIRSLIDKFHVSHCVNIVGEISNEELKKYLEKTKYWFSSSEYESFGIGLLESMAYGCIPIISDIPAFRELVIHNENGFLTNFENSEQTLSLFEKVSNLNNDELLKIQRNNQQKILDYKWENIVRKILDIYSSI